MLFVAALVMTAIASTPVAGHVCEPKPDSSCAYVGGICVHKRSDCGGRVLERRGWGCQNKCFCCKPDQTTPTPCPTTAMTTEDDMKLDNDNLEKAMKNLTEELNSRKDNEEIAMKILDEMNSKLDLIIAQDQATPEPLTCPTTTCAPSPTTDQATPEPLTCPTTTCAPSPTTDPTSDSNLNWSRVGDDRFVRFDQESVTFTNARDICRSHGLDIYRTRNSLAVAKYLADNGATKLYLIGARGDGTNLVWVATGDVVSRDGPWDGPQYYMPCTTCCVGLNTCCGYPDKERTLYSNGGTCNWGHPYFLCG